MNLFSCEQVTKYHPDKYADQISDAILTECLRQDRDSHVACETMVKNDTVIIAGEITTAGDIDYESIVRKVGSDLNYPVGDVINLITEQSPEINHAVVSDVRQGAGDQGVMFGYAVKGQDYLPYGFYLANKFCKALERKTALGSVLKGDAKVQVTVDLPDTGRYGVSSPESVKTILVSVCHHDYQPIDFVREYVEQTLSEVDYKAVDNAQLIINPSGAWTFGGPFADCGLTGRKIVCDQYGGYAPVGGGAFSGKDPSKVDRSATYMARKIACNVIDEFDVNKCNVQLAYGIGIADPLSVNVYTDSSLYLDKYISKWVSRNYDLTPSGIIKTLGLLDFDYYKMAGGCHMTYFM